ncbi:MAG: hypothetical protein OXC91_12200 [Rhodobacteraceae bacterium]|nr:hypothetical protein [Paracoccaceae bacterium]
MTGTPEWVVLEDGRLAIVQKRTGRGVEVRHPLGGRTQFLPPGKTRPFSPSDCPIRISATKRKAIKAAGQTPRDELEKVCNRCLTPKPIDAFDANRTRRDGSSTDRHAQCEGRALMVSGITPSARMDPAPSSRRLVHSGDVRFVRRMALLM